MDWVLLLLLLAILGFFWDTREHFLLNVGGKSWMSMKPQPDGYEVAAFRIVGMSDENTCPLYKPSFEDGLCYERCVKNYHGVGPICWANNYPNPGKSVELEPCPDGWSNDGLICREPIRWNGCKHRTPSWEAFGRRWGGDCIGGAEGGSLKGRLDGGGICENTPEGLLQKNKVTHESQLPRNKRPHNHKHALMCYKQCDEGMDFVHGMPSLCTANPNRLSYDRGVGDIPKMVRYGNKEHTWSLL